MDSMMMMGTTTAAAAANDPRDPNDISQLPRLRARVRGHVDAVIRCFPAAETQAYREAMERDSALVQQETDPLQFVRYCQYDLCRGAKRLCLYWTERKKLFGVDRAFLPLVLTGTGALTPRDLMALQAGFPALLIPGGETASYSSTSGTGMMGRPCFYVDRRRRCPNLTVENHLRCFFYLFAVVAENDWSQIDPVLAFMVSATPRTKGTLDTTLAHRVCALTKQIFPVKLKFHLLSLSKKRDPAFGSDIVHHSINVLRHYFLGFLDVNVHMETEPAKILAALKELGLSSKSIPIFLGGEWKFEDFSGWCQRRMEQEYQEHAHRLLPIEKCDGAKECRRAAGGSSSGSKGGRYLMDFTTFKASEVTDLVPVSEENGRDSTTNHHPENTAHKHNQSHHSAEDNHHHHKQHHNNKNDSAEQQRVAKRRLADRLYSRQKRERQRVNFQSLTEESSQLRRENESLTVENDRLQRLLTEADECIRQLSSSP